MNANPVETVGEGETWTWIHEWGAENEMSVRGMGVIVVVTTINHVP